MNGRILKIKTGYNPNSSSIGTAVSSFLKAAALFSVLSGALTAAVTALRGRRKEPHEESESPPCER